LLFDLFHECLRDVSQLAMCVLGEPNQDLERLPGAASSLRHQDALASSITARVCMAACICSTSVTARCRSSLAVATVPV